MIYNITQSIGKLNANHIEPPFCQPVDKSLYKMTAESKNLRTWLDYGTFSDDEITFYQDGESKFIVIDGFTFDNRVCINEKQVCTQGTIRHTFKLNGQAPNGKIFELQFCDEGKENHPVIKVIYAMTITSILGLDRIESMWERLTKFDYSLNIEDVIKLVKDIKNIANTNKDKFPYLSLFFQNAIHNYIQLGKVKMESFELFNA